MANDDVAIGSHSVSLSGVRATPFGPITTRRASPFGWVTPTPARWPGLLQAADDTARASCGFGEPETIGADVQFVPAAVLDTTAAVAGAETAL
jgi:hypothetical protein